ncbi:MAG: hypothetical protein L6R35_000743 [Caloplaca aegaea]|nr:MAG: hypothetical protein L6R35_000743 [Caloplaca aegaea]
MAPHRIPVDYDSMNSSISDSDFPSAGKADDYSSSSDDASDRVHSEPEPIAIVGMGCRLPGDVRSPLSLWNLLLKQQSAQSEVPAGRWNIDSYYHPNGEKGGSMNMRGGYFIKEDLRQFENDFFGINNLEATFMDPEQRKLLEVVYECLENAGVPLEKVSGANIGTYVGNFTIDMLMMQARDPEYMHRYNATGMGNPSSGEEMIEMGEPADGDDSFVLDTACSSSLYGLHLACQALDAGECDAAIVAAANLVQSPEQQIATMRAGVLSPTGTCHTFDSSADGYGRADGVGALYVKKLSKAIQDGDPIRSIIRGTAVNSNGKTQGITLPSAEGQEAVIRKAYRKAGLSQSMGETDYIECHGTGTAVGDPIEVEAVSRVFAEHRSERLLIGSVKTNLGHSESASGITSIIKTTLALESGRIPATIGVKSINPKIKLDDWGVQIVTDTTDWPGPKHSASFRRAGVNSFGYGGANSHAILESVDAYLPHPDHESSSVLSLSRPTFLVPLSANSLTALETQASDLASANLDHVNVVDLAHTLGTRRSKLPKRAFSLVGQKTLKDDLHPDCFRVNAGGSYSPLPIAFVFTGQGAQWPQMGKHLIEEFPSFRRSILDLDIVLQSLPEKPSWTLQQAILEPKKTSRISHVTQSQPVCTAVQVALIQLLAAWGISPKGGVIGHSSGEIAAAFAAGLLTPEKAIIIAYYRGYVVGNSSNPTRGAMMAAGMTKAAADADIQSLGLEGSIRVACVNSPESVTISGDESAIEVLLTELQSHGLFARKLNTDGRAYHSHHMSLIGQEYQELLERSFARLPATGSFPTTRWISSVYAEEITGKVLPSYWRKNLESPVLFSDALEGLLKDSKLHLVELGPHSALQLPIKQTRTKLNLSEDDVHYSSALVRDKNSTECILSLMGDLFLHGHDIAFAKINFVETSGPESKLARQQGTFVKDLPPYPWHYDSVLWSESRQSRELRNRRYPYHDLLGTQTTGGDGHTTTWRNILRVKDIPWVEGHKLGSQIVMPGAAYMAMALEAVCQVTGTVKSDRPSFCLRHVNILKALQMSADMNSAGVEIFTTLCPTQISGTSSSDKWFDFKIMSYEENGSVTHATGNICLEREPIIATTLSMPQDLEALATRNWYDRFIKTGLNFGPTFQTLKKIETHRRKKLMCTRSSIPFLQGGGEGISRESDYIIHPIAIDTMFQSALIASSAGLLKDLNCKVPTTIEIARFKTPTAAEGSSWTVDAVSKPTGFGSISISAEIHDDQGQICAQLENAGLIPFQGAWQEETIEERHPMLRVHWKPDISKVRPDNKERFVAALQASIATVADNAMSTYVQGLLGIVDLLAHKNPRLRILELGKPDTVVTHHLLTVLCFGSAFPRFSSYSRGILSDTDELLLEKVESIDQLSNTLEKAKPQTDMHFDLIILTTSESSKEYLINHSEPAKAILSAQGILTGLVPHQTATNTESPDVKTVSLAMKDGLDIIMTAKVSDTPEKKAKRQDMVVVERDGTQAFVDALVPKLAEQFGRIERVALENLSSYPLKPKTTVISTVELGKPILSTLTDSEMMSIKTMTDGAANLIWLTGGGNFLGRDPDYALVSGLARSLILEQPSLRFFTFDIDDWQTNLAITFNNLIQAVEEAQTTSELDFEMVQHEGIVHISRFVADENMNTAFRQKQGDQAMLKPLKQTGSLRLTIEKLGQFDTLAFKEDIPSSDELDVDFVEVEVKAVGLNAKDISVYSGKTDNLGATSSSECAGVITRVGRDVKDLVIGDRVVVMAPGHFATLEAFPQWACAKLRDAEAFHTVLIHAAAGGLGMAAIQIAQLRGAEVFATVSNKVKEDFLVQKFGIKRENIFNSSDSSFLAGVLAATNGKGVDVVLNSLSGDLLHDSWRACARFGRFVEVGKRDLIDAGKLDMQNFRRNVTFTAFDVSELCDVNDRVLSSVWEGLLNDVMSLYRDGKIRSLDPLRVFDSSEITQAFKYFSSKDRMGKIAISFEDKESLVKVLPLKYDTKFDSEKTYLMIGCLGGLGRSMSKWMTKQGARKFVFLGRSGLDRTPARKLVDELESSGAAVKVVRGDVGVYEDVQRCVDVVEGPIGGVIQAAMGLNEALWTTMSNEYWHTGIDPKRIGTWNLHNALLPHSSSLDFFLMTSSISGTVGTATESNYCAANYFLDVFARYRRSLGLPATSLGLGMISEVGYLHENPEIEALLLRKGIQAINEDELLQIVDIALSQAGGAEGNYDALADGHILTGLETSGLKLLRQKGFEGTNPTLNDPRALLLASALDGASASIAKSNSGLPAELAEALEGGNDKDILEVVLLLIKKRFSNLVLVPVEKVDDSRPLNSLGMDSMLAAEFRTWFYQAFKVDIPFLMLLSETVTLKRLAELVKEGVEEA